MASPVNCAIHCQVINSTTQEVENAQFLNIVILQDAQRSNIKLLSIHTVSSLTLEKHRQACIHYLHKHLHGIFDIVFGSIKIILQQIEKTQLLTVIHFN